MSNFFNRKSFFAREQYIECSALMEE